MDDSPRPLPIIRSRPFADLFRDPRDYRLVVNSITRTIRESFEPAHPATMRSPTNDEIRRRFAICERWFRDLRGERQWTIERCLAALPVALRAELTGGTYEPDRRMLWIPQDGAAR